MQLQANVVGDFARVSATVADKHAGIFLAFIGLGLFFTGLAMLPTSPSV